MPRMANFGISTRTSYLVAYLAAARLGAITTGINVRYRRTEIGHILGRSGAALVLAVERWQDAASAPRWRGCARRPACPRDRRSPRRARHRPRRRGGAAPSPRARDDDLARRPPRARARSARRRCGATPDVGLPTVVASRSGGSSASEAVAIATSVEE